ncbi:MAG: hypothetical protein ACKVOU_01540 [Cytophagales bacterium]
MTSTSDNKTSAFIVSLAIHTLLIAFLFLFILHTPNPPFDGGSGVVLNLGYVNEGSGEVQTLNELNDSKIIEENKPLDSEPQPVDNEVVEANTTEQNDGNILTSDEKSDVQAETTKEIEKKEIEEKKLVKPTVAAETKREIEKKINPAALFGGKSGTSTKGGNNNGDKNDAAGDQGNEKGDINAKALYGNVGTGGDGSGGSGGASLDLAGWKWDKKPKVKDENEDENGKIIYLITIDEQGELINLKLLETTVSPAVEKIYRSEVEKLSFVKTDNKAPASSSTGKITFIIRVK